MNSNYKDSFQKKTITVLKNSLPKNEEMMMKQLQLQNKQIRKNPKKSKTP